MGKKILASACLSLAATIGMTSMVSADGHEATAKDLLEIENLAYCYALGADAIGNGKVESDPLAAGLAIYEECFAEDATFGIWPAGMPFNSLSFPDRTGDMPPAIVIEGREAFAGMVNGSFSGAGGGDGYDFVQHNMTNVQIEADAEKGQLNAYLASVHVIHGEPGSPMRCRQQANGTYSMKVKKMDGVWKVTSLDLAQIAFDTIIENGKGC
ncbi:nuclear transport factor 2 family protein [Luminiphilus syltensis]|nr:nuclear transport factor 2 family protein [Luminiphilus syltensis]